MGAPPAGTSATFPASTSSPSVRTRRGHTKSSAPIIAPVKTAPRPARNVPRATRAVTSGTWTSAAGVAFEAAALLDVAASLHASDSCCLLGMKRSTSRSIAPYARRPGSRIGCCDELRGHGASRTARRLILSDDRPYPDTRYRGDVNGLFASLRRRPAWLVDVLIVLVMAALLAVELQPLYASTNDELGPYRSPD